MRPRKRAFCSSSEIENQYLISWMPEREYHDDYVRRPVPTEIIVPERY